MKMTGEPSPHNACGQILFCLKMSQLNYVVKETPYSAYVTIRKKFIHSVGPVPEAPFTNQHSENLKHAENELAVLKEKNKDLETRIAMATIELEEAETKIQTLDGKIVNLEDRIEEIYKENRYLTKEKDILDAAKKTLSEDLAKQKNENVEVKKENLKTKKCESERYLDKCDMIEILENTLRNKNEEINQLKLDFENAKGKEYLCSVCDFKCSNSSILTEHDKNNHAHKCDVCDLVVKSKEKLNIHICRVTINNPEHKNLYLKNWIVSKSCTTVFCKKQRKEVAILHSEECLDFDNCKGDEPLGVQYGIYHLRLSNCIRNGEVTWSNVITEDTE